MKTSVAERRLLYSLKGSGDRNDLVIRVGYPYLVDSESVNFRASEGTAVCKVEIAGLPDEIQNEVYGADLLQALQLAVNVDPILKRLSKKYDLFFPGGEPYFDSNDK